MIELGKRYRIIPDEDDFDNQLAKIVKVNGDDCDALVLTGPRAYETVKDWPHDNFVELSPLEQLAEVMQDDG